MTLVDTPRAGTGFAPLPASAGLRAPSRGRVLGTREPRERRSLAERAVLSLLMVMTTAGYLWDLSASGFANSFYAAAVEAGTKSWKAFFFGSLDSSNFITVDKPPASLWVMELSGRLFGFSSWSMLVPDALMGAGAVALVYATVHRWWGPAAGLVAAAALATTPVAALMFRFNNPDALLVLLMVVGAYCVTRAVERGSTRWLVACGAAVGFAFLAKMGEALLVVPGFGLAYILAAPLSLGRRLARSLAGGAAMVAAAGWWVLAVVLWPANDRPMIDGSPTNSILNLILGYNGLDRVLGSGGGRGGGGGANFSGSTGWLRLFNDLMGGQASWLLPAAFAVLAVGLVLTWRAPRADRARAGLVIWGTWLVAAATVFSFSKGTIHTYYTVAFTPAAAALVGIGAARLWRHRGSGWARASAAAAVAGTAAWSVALLDRTPTWEPWLRPLVIAAGGACIVALGLPALAHLVRGRRGVEVNGPPAPASSGLWGKANCTLAVAAAAIACAAGPLAYTVETIGTAHTGSVPSAGPTSTAGFGLGGSGGAGFGSRGFPGSAGSGNAPRGNKDSKGGAAGSGRASGNAFAAGGGPGSSASGAHGPSGGNSGGAGLGGAGFGSASVSSALVKLLEADAGHYRWVAVTGGSQEAASLELAMGGDPVMAIGGFDGQGGNLSLAAFERYVKEGAVHYLVAAGGAGGGGTWGTIEAWVEAHYTATTVGGVTVYNLATSK